MSGLDISVDERLDDVLGKHRGERIEKVSVTPFDAPKEKKPALCTSGSHPLLA
jgi:hypothetical protein